jgi:hypothetical protein
MLTQHHQKTLLTLNNARSSEIIPKHAILWQALKQIVGVRVVPEEEERNWFAEINNQSNLQDDAELDEDEEIEDEYKGEDDEERLGI